MTAVARAEEGAAPCRGVVVAAPSSGAGKTTLALGLVAALRARGLRVQPFKAGPDFIDAGHLARAAGRPAYNLDTFLTSPEHVVRLAARATGDADVAVLEGMMGLFDGVDGTSDRGSTAELAALVGWPVLLLLDAAAAARSIAAVLRGFRTFSPAIEVAAAVFNRIGGPGHLRMLADACSGEGVALLGGLPVEPRVAIAERHLGLHVAEESGARDYAPFGALVAQHLDLDALLALLRGAGDAPPHATAPPVARTPQGPHAQTRTARCRIAVARDAAFSFYYEENLEMLRDAGAEVVAWSPLAAGALPEDVDGLYLGGGYPELHLARLAAARPLHDAIRRFAAQGGMIYAECGGFMLLQRAIRLVDGSEAGVVGLLPGVAAMRPRLVALGYRELTLTLAEGRITARGHEFRHSELVDWPDDAARDGEPIASALAPSAAPAVGPVVAWRRVLAGYVHLHLASAPALAEVLVERAAAFRGARG